MDNSSGMKRRSGRPWKVGVGIVVGLAVVAGLVVLIANAGGGSAESTDETLSRIVSAVGC